MNKNILFITNLHLWSLDNGKGGLAFINTINGYKNEGWNVWFVSTGGGVPKNLIDHDKLFENSYPKLDKISLSKIRFLSILTRFFKLLLINHYFIKAGAKILQYNKNERFIIYAYEVESVYAASRLSKQFHCPLITRFQGTVHGNTPNTMINRIRKAPHLNAMRTAADLTIMTNDGTQGLKTLVRLGNKSKEVLFWRNGVNKIPDEILNNREQFRSQFGWKNKYVFITVSRLVNWKKVDRAISAFSVIEKTNPKAILVILGDGEEKNKLVQLVETLGLTEKIYFIGTIEQKMVCNYIIAADAFLSFYDISNVGNPLMEAMICGKPIITLDIGDTKEIINNDENGILLSINELHKIPDMMCKIINDKEYSNKLSSKALITANKEFWSWDDRIIAEITKVNILFDNYFN